MSPTSRRRSSTTADESKEKRRGKASSSRSEERYQLICQECGNEWSRTATYEMDDLFFGESCAACGAGKLRVIDTEFAEHEKMAGAKAKSS